MVIKILLSLVFVLFFCSTPVICQTRSIDTITRDTLTISGNSQNVHIENVKQDDEFNLFLLLFALAAISFMLGFIMLGMAAFLLMALLIILFVTTGIISTSIIVGWANKSYSSGLKYFLMITGSVCGITAGTLTFGLICLFFKISLTKSTILIAGGLVGLSGGLFLGYILFKVILLIVRTIRNKLNLKIKDTHS